MRVWIDQDLCTGDGLCAEIAPDVFFGMDDGLYYVKESAENFGAEKLFDGTSQPSRRRRHGPHPRRGSRTGHRIGRGNARARASSSTLTSDPSPPPDRDLSEETESMTVTTERQSRTYRRSACPTDAVVTKLAQLLAEEA